MTRVASTIANPRPIHPRGPLENGINACFGQSDDKKRSGLKSATVGPQYWAAGLGGGWIRRLLVKEPGCCARTSTYDSYGLHKYLP
jgi:hypothetical protein